MCAHTFLTLHTYVYEDTHIEYSVLTRVTYEEWTQSSVKRTHTVTDTHRVQRAHTFLTLLRGQSSEVTRQQVSFACVSRSLSKSQQVSLLPFVGILQVLDTPATTLHALVGLFTCIRRFLTLFRGHSSEVMLSLYVLINIRVLIGSICDLINICPHRFMTLL